MVTFGVMNTNFEMIAKTFFGFEDVLAEELKNLGAQDVTKGNRSVSFKGDTGFMYKANLCLRTALKILKPIKTFRVKNQEDLYRGVSQIDWQNYLLVNGTFSVNATVFSEHFNNSQFIVHKTKDAIVDQFRKLHNTRPNVDTEHPDLIVNVHIQREVCTVSLDSSGGSLHLRGYRTATNIAPINEVLAAGLILQTGWTGQTDFLDPMCGSGTFLIEAAMIACNIPANINRREFGFQHWLDYDEELFEKIENSLMNKIRNFDKQIIGYDKAPSAVKKAKENVKNANLTDFIQIYERNFFDTKKETDTPLTIVFNPPYDERLSVDIEKLYSQIGTVLKHGYPDSHVWFITANLDALKYVGLRPSKKIKTFNGKLEARFVNYQMYSGSKKIKKTLD